MMRPRFKCVCRSRVDGHGRRRARARVAAARARRRRSSPRRLARAARLPRSPPGGRAGYVIGPDDVLSIVFWTDKDLSGRSRPSVPTAR